MGSAPRGAPLVFLVDVVLDEAAKRLEGEGADYDDADYGVAVAGCELEDACGRLLVFPTWVWFEGGWGVDGSMLMMMTMMVGGGGKGRTCESG